MMAFCLIFPCELYKVIPRVAHVHLVLIRMQPIYVVGYGYIPLMVKCIGDVVPKEASNNLSIFIL